MELAATRFMYWTTFFAVDLMWLMMFIQTHRNGWNPVRWSSVEMMMVGAGIAGLSITLQQWFWWVNEHLRVTGNCASHDPLEYNVVMCLRKSQWYSYADYTMALYFSAVLGAALIVNAVVAELVKRAWSKAPRMLWLPIGVAFSAIAWGLGYSLVWFKVGA